MPPNTSYLAAQVIPPYWGWTAYTPVIPKLYWDVYSQEERIKRLCMEYDKLTHYASAIAEVVNDISDDVGEVIEQFKKDITAQLAAQNEAITAQLAAQDAKVSKELADMRAYIDMKFDQLAQGVLLYDITTGEYRHSNQAMRRLFQALSYDHKGDQQLVSYIAENNTVAQLGTMSVYHVAYSTRPDIVIDDQN